MTFDVQAFRLCDALDLGAVWPATAQIGPMALPEIGSFADRIDERTNQRAGPIFENGGSH